MDPITKIDNLTSAFDSQPSKKTSPYDQALQTLETFIDKLVTAENNAAKTDAQKAIQEAQLLQAYERKVAFLSGQIHRVESELSALEGSLAQASATTGQSPVLDSKRQEVIYWQSRLRQVVEANQLNQGL